ncbi:MAG TPA: DUF1993 domain-containing protein [Roseiarcus sp.]|nr:DUF1993 domain-containing protein [Roseiarcus sp.]
MKISAYTLSVETFASKLGSLSALLDKGAEHAKAAAFDPATLVNARLAPDMYPLATQVSLACRNAEDGAAKLIGGSRRPPPLVDDEKTFDGLKARIEEALAYLRSLDAAAFEGAEDRRVEIPIPNDGRKFVMTGGEFLRDWALPHFYFHVVTAYAILRHNGVELGKRDYMKDVGRYIRPLSG